MQERQRVFFRSQSRMLALQALCVFEAVGEDFAPALASFVRDENILTDLKIELPPQEEILVFAEELARDAWAARQKLDERLERAAVRWRVARMNPVDRNILRLALFELQRARPDSPPDAVMSEAVD